MKQVNLPSGTYLIQTVPVAEEWDLFNIDGKQYLNGCTSDGTMYHTETPLPPGSWQLLGADPTNLTEVEAEGIVEAVGIVEHGVREVWYADYVYSSGAYPTALQSLDSLSASLQISKPFVVLRNTKNIEK